MTNEVTWQRVKVILAQAIETTPGDRARYLTDACGDDFMLRRDVESFLARLHRDQEWLEGNALDLVETSYIGESIGAYRVVEELNSGGMGRIFKAVRNDGHFDTTVVIKLMRADLNSSESRQRFSLERQLLAQLNHPGIAHLLDGGIFNGSPYLVMEYVDGVSIQTYCASHALTLNQRLELFSAVCDAVEFAHRHFVVHRDLKPDNILITSDGAPKLLDFGIAKLVGSDSAGGHETVLNAVGPLTPQYAAPEQFLGRPITAATDVYALGALLFLILTGRTLYPDKAGKPLELMKAVCEEVAPLASRVVADRLSPPADPSILHGLPEPQALARSYAGDVDAICAGALEKEPERRYQTVGALKRDVRNYLDDRPLSARVPSWHYFAGKFLVRHRVAAAFSSVAIVALTIGIVAILWEAQRARSAQTLARNRADIVQKLSEKLIFDYNDRIAAIPGALPIAIDMAADTGAFLDQIAAEGGQDDTGLQRDLENGYRRLAAEQGSYRYSSSGALEAAQKNREKALQIATHLYKKNPRDADIVKEYLKLLDDEESQAEHDSKFDLAGRQLTHAEAIAREAIEANPGDKALPRLLAAFLSEEGVIAGHHRGEYGAAIALTDQSIAILRLLVQENPADWEARTDLATALVANGLYFLRIGEEAKVTDAFRAGVAERREVYRQRPNDVEATLRYAQDLYRLENRDRHDRKLARAEMDELFAVFAPLKANMSGDPIVQYSYVLFQLANVDLFRSSGELAGEPDRILREVDALARSRLQADPKSNDNRYLAASVREDWGGLQFARHEFDLAYESFHAAAATLRDDAEGDDLRLWSWAGYQRDAVASLLAAGRTREAREELASAGELIERAYKDHQASTYLSARAAFSALLGDSYRIEMARTKIDTRNLRARAASSYDAALATVAASAGNGKRQELDKITANSARSGLAALGSTGSPVNLADWVLDF